MKKCKECFYYIDCEDNEKFSKKCKSNDCQYWSPDCNQCEYFNYTQSQKYCGHPCDLHGNLVNKCNDFVLTKTNNECKITT